MNNHNDEVSLTEAVTAGLQLTQTLLDGLGDRLDAEGRDKYAGRVLRLRYFVRYLAGEVDEAELNSAADVADLASDLMEAASDARQWAAHCVSQGCAEWEAGGWNWEGKATQLRAAATKYAGG